MTTTSPELTTQGTKAFSSTTPNITSKIGEEGKEKQWHMAKRQKLDASETKDDDDSLSVTSSGEATHLSETQVGITSFVYRKSRHFQGIIKHRVADFHVNEVDMAGSIIRLQSQSSTPIPAPTPPPPVISANLEGRPHQTSEEVAEYIRQKEAAQKETDDALAEQGYNAIRTLFTGVDTVQDLIDAINDLRTQVPPISETSLVKTHSISEKTVRTQFHALVKRHFKRLITETGEGGVIVVRKGTPKDMRDNRQRFQGRKSRDQKWADLGGEYCHFSLYKENIDTIAAISKLAKIMRMPSKEFGYAGTKDKRAITVQRISAHRVTIPQLAALNKSLTGMYLADFAYSPKRICLGDLSGNHFSIVLRNITVSAGDEDGGAESQSLDLDVLNGAFESLQQRGFINYFGMQRFGTRAVGTHEVGIHILQGKWEEAINAILFPKNDTREDLALARQYWADTRDVDGALRLFPRMCTAERAVLEGMSRTSNQNGPPNYFMALLAIPRPLRTMYLHAYQSMVWNKVASLRWETYGSEVVIGDLVTLDTAKGGDEDTSATADGDDDTDSPKDGKPAKMSVKVIETEEECKLYTIQDVILPLPGYDIVYPENQVLKSAYVQIMSQDGLDPFEMRRKQREISLTGNYRRLMAFPTNMSWRVIRYDDGNAALLESDLDRASGLSSTIASESQTLNLQGNGKYLAVGFEFTLPSGTYATMAMRELCRLDSTTASHHQSLSMSSHPSSP